MLVSGSISPLPPPGRDSPYTARSTPLPPYQPQLLVTPPPSYNSGQGMLPSDHSNVRTNCITLSLVSYNTIQPIRRSPGEPEPGHKPNQFHLFDCKSYVDSDGSNLRLLHFEYPPLCGEDNQSSNGDLQSHWDTVRRKYPWMAVIHGDDNPHDYPNDRIDRSLLLHLCQAALSDMDNSPSVNYLWLDALCVDIPPTERQVWREVHNVEKVFRYAAKTVVLLNNLERPLPSLEKQNTNPGIHAPPAIARSFTVFLQLILSSMRSDQKIWIPFQWNNAPRHENVFLCDPQSTPGKQWRVFKDSMSSYTVALVEFDAYLHAATRQINEGGILQLSHNGNSRSQPGASRRMGNEFKFFCPRGPNETHLYEQTNALRQILEVTRSAHSLSGGLILSARPRFDPVTTNADQGEREHLVWKNAAHFQKAAHSSTQFVSGIAFLLQDIYPGPGAAIEGHGLTAALQGASSTLDILPTLVHSLDNFRPPPSQFGPLDISIQVPLLLDWRKILRIMQGPQDFELTECCALTLVPLIHELRVARLALQLDAMQVRPPQPSENQGAIHVALLVVRISNHPSLIAVELIPTHRSPNGNRQPSQSHTRAQHWTAGKYVSYRPSNEVLEAVEESHNSRNRRAYLL